MGLKTGKDEKPTVRRAKLKLRPPDLSLSRTLTNFKNRKKRRGFASPLFTPPNSFIHTFSFTLPFFLFFLKLKISTTTNQLNHFH